MRLKNKYYFIFFKFIFSVKKVNEIEFKINIDFIELVSKKNVESTLHYNML